MRIAGSIDTEVISRGQGSISDKQTSNSWEPVSHNEKKRKRDAPHGAQRAELGHFVIQACEHLCSYLEALLTIVG